MAIILNVYALSDKVTLPSYGTTLSTCFDLSFNPTTNEVSGYDAENNPIRRTVDFISATVMINPGDRILIPTGLVMKLHGCFSDYYADRTAEDLRKFSIRIHPRSGMALKRGLVLANCEGIVDVDYQEQVYVLLTNISSVPAFVAVTERVAQGEVVSNEPTAIVLVNERPVHYSERSSGFGSTGYI